MPKRTLAIPKHDVPFVEIESRGREGPGRRIRLGTEQLAAIARTVRRTPEVIVKVSGGARDSGGAQAHFAYIDRHGKLEIHTDDGLSLLGKGAAKAMVHDWNLETSSGQYRPAPSAGTKDRRPKAVHNVVLSMPDATSPIAVLAAAKQFARENFALQYRYAMVLHTDQRHPHVHLVVKAEHEFEPGKRLYIRKATLQRWREEFASALRAQGVAANATPRQLRGRTSTTKKDAIHHRLRAAAAHRRLPPEVQERQKSPPPSSFMQQKVTAVAKQLRAGWLPTEPGKQRLAETRERVRAAWLDTARQLREQGHSQLADETAAFAKSLPAAQTENELIAAELVSQIKAQRRTSRPVATSATRPERPR